MDDFQGRYSCVNYNLEKLSSDLYDGLRKNAELVYEGDKKCVPAIFHSQGNTIYLNLEYLVTMAHLLNIRVVGKENKKLINLIEDIIKKYEIKW